MNDKPEGRTLKQISVIGAGYVGLVSGACLAKLGHQVTLVDTDHEKLTNIKQGKSPFYEPGLGELLVNPLLKVSSDIKASVSQSQITFVCVGTANNHIGCTTDLCNLKQAAQEMASALQHHHLVVLKSTAPPGTAENVLIPLFQKKGKTQGQDFAVCVNPEFLREGSAVKDFLSPDRVVIGQADSKEGEILEGLFAGLDCPIFKCDLKTAEMIKYTANAFLAARVSLTNEIGNICKLLGIDSRQVAQGIGYDERIGSKFLEAGIGFGGSCLPKDLHALIDVAKELGYQPKLLEEVAALNQRQPLKVIELLKKHMPDLRGKEIGVLGLAFKSGTDDVRESQARPIISALLQEGAKVKAYDPQAMANFRKLVPDIQYTTPQTVLNCQAILILANWPEFEKYDYRGKLVIDGRHLPRAKQQARVYDGVCW